jgi:hypothetical protein
VHKEGKIIYYGYYNWSWCTNNKTTLILFPVQLMFINAKYMVSQYFACQTASLPVRLIPWFPGSGRGSHKFGEP